MAKRKPQDFGVKANDSVILRGEVAFAILVEKAKDKILENENQRRRSRGLGDMQPFYRIELKNPQIVGNANSPLAQYIQEERFYSKKTGGQFFSEDSTSKFPLKFGHVRNGVVKQIEVPNANPANGQQVDILVRTFVNPNFPQNMSMTFDQIVFPEGDIKFYESSNTGLTGYGTIMNMPVENLQNAQEQPKEIDGNAQAFNQGYEQPAQQFEQPAQQFEQPVQQFNQPVQQPVQQDNQFQNQGNQFAQNQPQQNPYDQGQGQAQNQFQQPIQNPGYDASGNSMDNPFANSGN